MTDVGYAQIKKQISNSPKFLSVGWRLLVTCRRLCEVQGLHFTYSCVKACIPEMCEYTDVTHVSCYGHKKPCICLILPVRLHKFGSVKHCTKDTSEYASFSDAC